MNGRPTKYDPQFCELLIVHMAQGFSFESFAADIDVCRDTLYEWAKVYEEFSDAKKRATMKSLKYWEMIGMKGLTVTSGGKETFHENINTTLWIFNMKNRHSWRDKQPDEDATNVQVTNVVQISDEQAEKIVKLARGEK